MKIKSFINKLNKLLAPTLTVLTVLGAIIYGSYFAAAYYIKSVNTDTDHEGRIVTLETEFKDISRKQDQIQFVQNQMLTIIQRMEQSQHEMVDQRV
jgi:hypothetical protein